MQERCADCSRTAMDGRVQGVHPPWEQGQGPALWGRMLAGGHPLDQLRWDLLLEQLSLVPSGR